ncbi:MAG: chromosome segregation protein SMC [Raoultibacter sp.]
MYLKSLVLKGFKSFADRSVLTFEPGVSAVVGPNGSGKSNISDAVLWVLGERNAKNLRGQAMEDVIFSGSSARKPVGIAEVDLILDNSDGTLPIDYSEVALTRRMYRSGESEYLINGALARRMDVLDILHDTGLGTGTHSIISQGSLDSILQSKPEDRRALIEEAAGVLKHKQRKLKSQRKLEQMDAHLMRVKDVASEVERQLKPLERKARRALAYQDLSAELGALNLVLAVDDLRGLQAKWDGLCAQEIEANTALEAARQRIVEAEAAAEALQARLRSEGLDAGQLATHYRRAQTALERFDANTLLLREKKRSLQRYSDDAVVSLEENKAKMQAACAERDAAQQTLAQVAGDLQQAQAAAQQKAQARDEVAARIKELSAALDAARTQQRGLRNDSEAATRRLAQTKEVLSNNLAHEKLIAGHGKELETQLAAAQLDGEAATQEATRVAAALADLQARDARARTTIAASLQAREATQEAFDAAREGATQTGAEIRALEEMQRAQESANPALTWLLENKERFDAQMAPITHVLSAPAEFESLLEVLLGSDLAALFVRDAHAANLVADAVVAAADTGALVLLPQLGMRGGAARPERIGEAARLVEKLSYPAAYAAAIEALLGDVYVCANPAAALAAYACQAPEALGARFVTAQGFMVWPNGKIALALKQEGEQGVLARHRQIESLRGALAQAQAAGDLARTARDQAEEALRGAQAESLQVSQQLAQTRGQNDACAQELKRTQDKLSALRREYAGLEAQRDDAQQALALARPDAEELEKRLAHLGEQLEASLAQTKKIHRELDPVQATSAQVNEAATLAKLEVATLTERELYASRMLTTRQRDIAALEAAAEAIAKSSTTNARAQLCIDPLLALLEQLRQSASRWTQRLEAETLNAQSASAGLHTSLDGARQTVHAAQAAFDEINATCTQQRVDKGRLEMQVEAAISTIVHDCKVPLDVALETPELEDRAETEDKTFKLRRKIANMGTINPDAAAEYEGLKKRYDYMASQLDDLETARRALSKIVRVIDARMKDDFVKTFEVIDKSFQEIFAVLFPGGSAHLTLVDPDDLENTGVEVNAQPRGKRISKMMLMSGGEKSLTALALLFAVYRTRATPFYILDEVEAALDDTNLRRLTAYLETLREGVQLILITHQRRTMEMADALFGVSMQSDGVTKVVSQKLDRALTYAEG